MNQVESSDLVRFQNQPKKGKANLQLSEREAKEVKNFMKYKNNSYFEACSKLLHPSLFKKIVS